MYTIEDITNQKIVVVNDDPDKIKEIVKKVNDNSASGTNRYYWIVDQMWWECSNLRPDMVREFIKASDIYIGTILVCNDGINIKEVTI
jgi:hypothetical protein